MKQLLIIGARGWGREVYDIAKDCIAAGAELKVKGFLDDKSDALDGYENYPSIIGPVETYVIQQDDVFICALGEVGYKKHYSDIINAKGGEFISLVHPTAVLGNNAKIGRGCVVGAYANLSSDTRIGDFVAFSIKAGMGHDSSVGDYSHIGGFCNISGFVTIGKMVTIHPCCNILPHKKIEDEAVVGASSVVLANVKRGKTVYGNPARIFEF
jgi:sugar O-acyltransferase (sialic acid O-acetyltransferase NeuD family)